jgi:hypothetical protein
MKNERKTMQKRDYRTQLVAHEKMKKVLQHSLTSTEDKRRIKNAKRERTITQHLKREKSLTHAQYKRRNETGLDLRTKRHDYMHDSSPSDIYVACSIELKSN